MGGKHVTQKNEVNIHLGIVWMIDKMCGISSVIPA